MWNTTETITYALPDWMRQARRGVDWGVLLVIALSLLAAWSFIRYPDLPHTNASENYVYRTADYAAALQEGQLYPRWSSNVLGGYGAPIPNYYPPVATYGAALIQILLTDDPVSAVRLIYIFSLCLAGSAVYVLVMRRSGASAGILAALLYVYSPYVGLARPHVLGDLPGVVALALIPSLLWAVDRLIVSNHPLDVFFTALLTALLCATSMHGTLAGIVLAVCLIGWQWWSDSEKASVWLSLGSMVLGIGLASFYWVPFLLEQSAIHWRPSVIPVEAMHLTLIDLFTPLRSLDPNEMVVTPQLSIGLLGVIFALAGGVALFRFKRKIGFQGLFLVVGVITGILALLVFPTEIWLLGPLMLCLSIGGSGALSLRDYLPRRRRRLVLPALVIVIWIGSTAIWFAPQYQEVFGDTSAAAQVQYEQQGYGVAVLPPGDALPSSLPDSAGYNRSLIDSYQSETVNKIAPGQISIDFQASPLAHFTHIDHFQLRQVRIPKPLEILTAYFPGWYATLADRSVTLSRSANGLISVDIPTLPRTNSELIVALGTTDVRRGGWLMSGIVLLFTGVFTFRRIRRRKSGFEELILLSRSESRLMAVPAACFVVITLVSSYGSIPLSLGARPDTNLSSSVNVSARTDAGLSLLAFQLDDNQHVPGDTVSLTLFWQAQRVLTENYKVKVYLVNNRDGSLWDETGFRMPGFYPTRRWNTRQYVTDRYQLMIPSDITPGNYQIRVEASGCNPDCLTENGLTFFSSIGQNQGMSFTLPTLMTVSR